MTRSDMPLPDSHGQLLEELKRTVAESRWRAQRVVNTELVRMYWRTGRAIRTRQEVEGWASRVVDRLSTDLRAAFPSIRGLSRNLKYMRQMAAVWPEDAVGQQPVGQLRWGHIGVLLDKLDDGARRDWYAAAAAERENLALAATRDALLPGLMSGRLLVRDAERVASEVT